LLWLSLSSRLETLAGLKFARCVTLPVHGHVANLNQVDGFPSNKTLEKLSFDLVQDFYHLINSAEQLA